jgi:hypothetical protein
MITLKKLQVASYRFIVLDGKGTNDEDHEFLSTQLRELKTGGSLSHRSSCPMILVPRSVVINIKGSITESLSLSTVPRTIVSSSPFSTLLPKWFSSLNPKVTAS